MPTVGIKVDEETKKKWDILNKHPDRIGTKELKKALQKIIEEYGWWIETYERMTAQEPEKTDEDLIIQISEQEILSEI